MNPDLKFPIGKFVRPDKVSTAERAGAVETLARLPELLRNAVDGLASAQVNTPYRDGGWTVRQVVHHLADSHMNAFIRVKLALTEDWPAIKPYQQEAWATLQDAAAPVEWSLQIVEGVHARWVMLLQSMDEGQWVRGFVHPENGKMGLEVATLLYAWHSRHHVAHINHLRTREEW